MDFEDTDKLIYTVMQLPKSGTLFASGTKILKTPYIVQNPEALTFDPINGETSISFAYKVTDSDGISSETMNVSMSFTELELSGHIFNDGNIDNNVSGPVISKADKQQLFVLLMDTQKKLLSAKPIERNGTYVI